MAGPSAIQGGGPSPGPHAAADWQAVHDARDLQFAPIPDWHQPPPPEWLAAFARLLKAVFGPVARALGLSWPVLQAVLIGLAALGLGLLLWQIGSALWAAWRRRQPANDTPTWTPDAPAARALLADADHLAAAGRYDEAAHLLLLRSFDQIAAARPDWLHPASTAREIAQLAALAPPARAAFAMIAGLVEQGRYALRPLGAAGWEAARAAYAGFALERIAP
jgi:hypothetical protein